MVRLESAALHCLSSDSWFTRPFLAVTDQAHETMSSPESHPFQLPLSIGPPHNEKLDYDTRLETCSSDSRGRLLGDEDTGPSSLTESIQARVALWSAWHAPIRFRLWRIARVVFLAMIVAGMLLPGNLLKAMTRRIWHGLLRSDEKSSGDMLAHLRSIYPKQNIRDVRLPSACVESRFEDAGYAFHSIDDDTVTSQSRWFAAIQDASGKAKFKMLQSQLLFSQACADLWISQGKFCDDLAQSGLPESRMEFAWTFVEPDQHWSVWKDHFVNEDLDFSMQKGTRPKNFR